MQGSQMQIISVLVQYIFCFIVCSVWAMEETMESIKWAVDCIVYDARLVNNVANEQLMQVPCFCIKKCRPAHLNRIYYNGVHLQPRYE